MCDLPSQGWQLSQQQPVPPKPTTAPQCESAPAHLNASSRDMVDASSRKASTSRRSNATNALSMILILGLTEGCGAGRASAEWGRVCPGVAHGMFSIRRSSLTSVMSAPFSCNVFRPESHADDAGKTCGRSLGAFLSWQKPVTIFFNSNCRRHSLRG